MSEVLGLSSPKGVDEGLDYGPLSSEIINLEIESSGTTGSVKTKIQDREGCRSSSKPSPTRHLISD
jgi:hypothetical protein